MRPSPLRRLLGLALAVALAGCRGGCRGAPAGPAPERLLPAAVRAAVVVPEAGRAASELAALHASVSDFPGAGDLAASRGALAAQLGFDPLDPEALAEAGVDPRRGAALALLDRPGPRGEPGTATLVVLPAADVPKIERLLLRLAKDRAGATERAAKAHGKVETVELRRPGAAAPALTYALVDRAVLLTTHPAGAALLAEAGALPEAASLGADPAFRVARAALGPRPSAIAWVPRGSGLLQGMWALKDGVALGLATATGRLDARVAMLLGERGASFKALAADGKAAALAARLDPEAPLAARWDGDFAALGKKIVPIVPADDRAALARRGVDLEADLFGLLAPGGAAVLLPPAALSLTGLTAAAARADPLRAVRFEALLPVRRDAEVPAALERLGRAAGARRDRGAETWRLQTPSGEIAWALDAERGRLLVVGGPPGRLDALAARAAGEGPGWKAPTDAAAAALSGGLGGAALDAPRLVAAVRALPDEAFGGGPSGFVMRSLAERIVEPAARLAAVSLRADLAEGALLLDLAIEARPAAPEGGR